MDDLSLYLEPGRAGTELFVLIHGLKDTGRRLFDARTVIRAAHPDADLLAPRLPYASMLCYEKAESIVAALIDYIDTLDQEKQYSTITIVGHSLGAVLARKIAIIAQGEQASADGDVQAPFEPELQQFRTARSWAGRIDRVVLLAGMNRGWSASSTMDWVTGVKWATGELLGELFANGELTAFAIRRGAPFLVQTRLQWLSMMNPDYGARPKLLVVQLLGTRDDMVSPDDNVDFSVDLFGNRDVASFFYLEVSQSNHNNVVEMAESGPPGTAGARAERRTKFLSALHDDRDRLGVISIRRELMADNMPPLPDPQVDDLVFVIHGIRDKGFWTQKLARKIKQRAPPGRKVASWTESYGYFAMLPFALHTVRQRKVAWLMDRYVEARARFPNATFHYVGHSNGTFLAAQALKDYPAARFDRIVFAGSVVRSDYPWEQKMEVPEGKKGQRPQAGSLLNYVATRDWVVAMLPNSVRRWRSFNVGGSGHNGFDCPSSDRIHQLNYIVGAHGVGHQEENWNDIADFIWSGVPPSFDAARHSAKQNRFWRQAGRASIVVTPLGVSLVLLLGLLQFLSIFGALSYLPGVKSYWWLTDRPDALGAALRAMGFFAYLMAVATIVTRV
jgi:pimeloyl-ACP methyl ester carboxylesterase